MNNFPAMTEAQRRQLIESCQLEIKENPHSPHAQMAKIALAALTAEPVAYVHPAYLQPGALGFDASVGRLAPAQVELFIAPPVPVLKPIELPGKGGVEATSEKSIRDWSDGWSAYREEAIKAIRAAGYEVKL